jgi:hypothetical protein
MANLPVKERQAISLRTYLAKAWTGAAVGPVGISESSSANTFLPSFTNQPKTHWVSQCTFTAYHYMCLQSSLMGTINSTQSPGNLSKGK